MVAMAHTLGEERRENIMKDLGGNTKYSSTLGPTVVGDSSYCQSAHDKTAIVRLELQSIHGPSTGSPRGRLRSARAEVGLKIQSASLDTFSIFAKRI